MLADKPNDFWETSHSSVSPDDVNLGFGVRQVGGGQSDLEVAALYQLGEINAERVLYAFNESKEQNPVSTRANM
jgi:hypothetical protein